MEVLNQVRQGDMIPLKISEKSAKEIMSKATKKQQLPSITVGVGEATGHSHDVLVVGNEKKENKITAYLQERESLEGNNVAAITNLFFELEEAGVIVHDEHNPILLEKGFYVRINQREYNPFNAMYQQVRD